jgi:hypothetical protein
LLSWTDRTIGSHYRIGTPDGSLSASNRNDARFFN